MADKSNEQQLSPISTIVLDGLIYRSEAVSSCPTEERGFVAVGGAHALLRQIAKLEKDEATKSLKSIHDLCNEYLDKLK
jgi:hypothetical protein